MPQVMTLAHEFREDTTQQVQRDLHSPAAGRDPWRVPAGWEAWGSHHLSEGFHAALLSSQPGAPGPLQFQGRANLPSPAGQGAGAGTIASALDFQAHTSACQWRYCPS